MVGSLVIKATGLEGAAEMGAGIALGASEGDSVATEGDSVGFSDGSAISLTVGTVVEVGLIVGALDTIGVFVGARDGLHVVGIRLRPLPLVGLADCIGDLVGVSVPFTTGRTVGDCDSIVGLRVGACDCTVGLRVDD